MKGLSLLLCLAGFLLACGRTEGSRPIVEYSGCWEISLPGPVCALYPASDSAPRLRLWVQAEPGTEVEIRAGGRLLEGEGREVKGGLFFHVAIPPESPSLTVRLRRPGGALGPPWLLALAPPQAPVWWPEVLALIERGPEEELRRRLTEIQATAPRKEQGRASRMLALLLLQEGREEQAMDVLRRGIAADRETGVLSGELEKKALLAWLHLGHGRFAEVRRLLVLPPEAPTDARFMAAYYQGLLAEQVGDYRSALDELRQSADLAARVERVQHRWKAEQMLARVLQSVGRSQEAVALFARLRAEPHPEQPCDIGSLLTNLAWSRLLAREGGEQPGDPTPELEEARDVFDQESCLPRQRLNARINLALAHQQAGRRSEARQALEEIRPLAAQANLSQLLWWLDLEGRDAISAKDPARALDFYGELAELAHSTLSLEGAFRAAVGRARARLLLGERGAAIEDLARADRLLDEQVWLIPADQGRETFVAQREQATQLYLRLLLEDGRLQDAFTLVRRARSRLLRQLAMRDRLAELTPAEQERWEQALSRYWELRSAVDQQAAEEWQLPGDQKKRAREDRASQLAEARSDLDAAMADLGAPKARGEGRLSPPRPGEVILAYHPLPQGWVGFAAHPGGIETSTFALPSGALDDPAALSRKLLAPFRHLLDRAERLRVLPYGLLRFVDFHALPLDGEPLLARHLVVYSLDLPARPAAALPARPVALLVADPEGNLPEARREAEAVGAALHAWRGRWALRRLDGLAATARAVLKTLPDADLFHFAGHGSFAGFAGWDSALQLADGSRLTLADLLALHRVPSWVVLSSCEAGLSSEQARGEGVGLAQAFLLAGSRAVVAATERVEDRTARALVDELYQGWEPGADLPRQLQRAQLALRQREPDAGWQSFRLFEP